MKTKSMVPVTSTLTVEEARRAVELLDHIAGADGKASYSKEELRAARDMFTQGTPKSDTVSAHGRGFSLQHRVKLFAPDTPLTAANLMALRAALQHGIQTATHPVQSPQDATMCENPRHVPVERRGIDPCYTPSSDACRSQTGAIPPEVPARWGVDVHMQVDPQSRRVSSIEGAAGQTCADDGKSVAPGYEPPQSLRFHFSPKK
jgi:hypothetical protein